VNKKALCSYILILNTTDTKQYIDHPTVLLLKVMERSISQKTLYRTGKIKLVDIRMMRGLI
jgi:hypothetical protein